MLDKWINHKKIKECKELEHARAFAKVIFKEQPFHIRNGKNPIDVLAKTEQGEFAWELTSIATHKDGFAFMETKEQILRMLLEKLKAHEMNGLHFCLHFRPEVYYKIRNREFATSIICDFITRNMPAKLPNHGVYEFDFSHTEEVYHILEHISCIALEQDADVGVFQGGAFWSGGLKKPKVDNIISGKNAKLHIKRAVMPDCPHWLIMVLEFHECSTAAFWEKLEHEKFSFDYDRCFIFERLTNSCVELTR